MATHWLYPMFGAYCREHMLTADEAIERIQEQFPSLPVALIVRAQGRVDRIAELLAADEAQAQQGSGNQQGQQQQGSGNGQRPPSQRQEAEAMESDINAMLRGTGSRAQTGNLTAADIANAGTGRTVDGAGAYKPEDDPFRARFAERAARRG